jgi:hypothetical protein
MYYFRFSHLNWRIAAQYNGTALQTGSTARLYGDVRNSDQHWPFSQALRPCRPAKFNFEVRLFSTYMFLS